MRTNLIYNSLPMRRLSGAQFDVLLARGYRLLGHSMIQHSKSRTFGVLCDTLPLRIRLKDFAFSKSQRRLLRQNQDLAIRKGIFELDDSKIQLFKAHSSRFQDNSAKASIDAFLTKDAGRLPTEGIEICLYHQEKLLASSIHHNGEESCNSTYGFFDPAEAKRSLGNYTMLLEIQAAKAEGKDYYYLGYTHSIPSQFDYKLNFNNLEKMNWNTYEWKSTPRVVPKNWMKHWEGESIEAWNGMELCDH